MNLRLRDKSGLVEAVEELDVLLRELALRIHANPELSFYEFKAAEWLTDPLMDAGFVVERGIADLPTAFRATWEGEQGGPHIALLAEYDALPKLGHACGHNIIGTAAVGAALALKRAYPNLKAKISVFGTPAEEDGGGKIIMCKHGLFDDVDVAMLCHPRNRTEVLRGSLACSDMTLKFYGKPAHASSAPEQGISALDALINSFVAINGLRQFLGRDVRIHGIITNGGEAPNIVPSFCEAKFILRAPTTKELAVVVDRVRNAVVHSAASCGATCEFEEGLVYAERKNNKTLANAFKENLVSMGLEVSESVDGGLGSSDIGNVGHITPTIHPYINIGPYINHTPEFAAAAGSEEGMIAMGYAAKALAMTAFDVSTDAELLNEIRSEFDVSNRS